MKVCIQSQPTSFNVQQCSLKSNNVCWCLQMSAKSMQCPPNVLYVKYRDNWTSADLSHLCTNKMWRSWRPTSPPHLTDRMPLRSSSSRDYGAWDSNQPSTNSEYAVLVFNKNRKREGESGQVHLIQSNQFHQLSHKSHQLNQSDKP